MQAAKTLARLCICEGLYEPWLLTEEISTVKPVLSGHLKIDKTKISMTDGSLMQVKSIAECSKRAFCNIFDLH